MPSHSLTESPNHTDYKLRPDSFMAGGISRKAIAGQRSRAQRICLLFSPVNRIPLRHFVQFFHNHFRLVLNSTCKCNRILINNLFKFFVW
ncbi:MAG: hypothetical protein DBY04_07820, partial [Clostridiales bacterium]